MKAERIDWALFESQYWSPEQGAGYELVLANWRMEYRSYDDDKTEKPVIIFDVLRVDKKEYPVGRKLFVTGASSFAEPARPIIERSEQEGRNTVNIYIEYTKGKQYRVMDMSRVRRIVDEQEEKREGR